MIPACLRRRWCLSRSPGSDATSCYDRHAIQATYMHHSTPKPLRKFTIIPFPMQQTTAKANGLLNCCQICLRKNCEMRVIVTAQLDICVKQKKNTRHGFLIKARGKLYFRKAFCLTLMPTSTRLRFLCNYSQWKPHQHLWCTLNLASAVKTSNSLNIFSLCYFLSHRFRGQRKKRRWISDWRIESSGTRACKMLYNRIYHWLNSHKATVEW